MIRPSTFLYEHDTGTGVATITLNRPDRLNALTFATYDELRRTFRAINDEENVRAVVLTGSGRAFCSGGTCTTSSARWSNASIADSWSSPG